MSWFEEGRFGLFLHWGLYALNGETEWLMYNSEMTPEEYRERFFNYFEPDLFDPKEWARLAKNAGMKYFVITAKHHDGFCLWDTKTTDFNAMNAPLCRRDLLKDIIEAFREEGLKVGVYCTLPDWRSCWLNWLAWRTKFCPRSRPKLRRLTTKLLPPLKLSTT